MRKLIPILLTLVLISCGTEPKKGNKGAGTTQVELLKADSLPAEVKYETPFLSFDIESLKDNIDLNMDISTLNLAEIRILRNAFYARQGYCFMKADLRGIFSTTSWYNKIMEDRYWAEDSEKPMPDISLTDQEQQFVDKLLKREEELKKENFITVSERVYPNISNLVNLYQMKEVKPTLLKKLAQNGFAIVPGSEIQLFHVYEENDYKQFPNFVTTDLYLQIMHMYFGYVLRTLEEEEFIPLLSELTQSMMDSMKEIAASDPDEETREIANYNYTFYAIANSLLLDRDVDVPKDYAGMYRDELVNVLAANDGLSEFLEYRDVVFPYSLFKPRGHYTRTESLKRYFRAMMWLQTAPFCLDNDRQLKRALLSAQVLSNSSGQENSILTKYEAILDPVSYLIGEPDNLSFYQLTKIFKDKNLTFNDLITDKKAFNDFRNTLKQRAQQQNKIKPKQALSCVDKINFMPQRYLPDNEVLQELVDVESPQTKRGYPKGLDVMAAFGSSSAENLLLNEIGEDKSWPEYPEKLAMMKAKMKNVNWDATVYNKWIESLLNLQKPDQRYPYFMQNKAWDKKDLNASLASWAELKHDAILYAEQPMAAECGGGGPPDPYTLSYVEPNVAYWTTALEMIDLTQEVLRKNNLVVPEIDRVSERLKENAEFLLAASKKELAGQKLSEQEYREIEYIGSTFEWITLDLVRQKDQYLDSWYNVQGPDKSVSVVADVYTSNASNNSDKGILHVATGNVNDIYVVAEIEGYLYLCRGAVLEYREFHLPMGNRLTDEEWQQMLERGQARGVPEWMQEIMLPDAKPEMNQKIFYSSGC